MKTLVPSLIAATVAATLALPTAAAAPAYRNKIANDVSACRGGPAVTVRINGITPGRGTLRVQLYRATAADWLKTGRWLNRIEVQAHGSTATVCMPVPEPGRYGIAVRHDVNGNGKSDIRADGGGMSNNPAINVFNLGKPSFDKAAFSVGRDVKTISIQMRYL